jgi:hypothetical protein
MRRSTSMVSVILMLGSLAPGLASARLNLSGTWQLDQNRSFSNPAGLDQTMTIVHNGDEVTLDAKITVQGRETQVNEKWLLDGKEREFTPPGAPPDSTGKRKASRLPDDKGILVEDASVANTPKGEVNQRTTRKYTLSADGNTLIVDYFIDRGEQSFESKRVFARKP